MPTSSVHRKNIDRLGQIFRTSQNTIAIPPARNTAATMSRPADRASRVDPCWLRSTHLAMIGTYWAGLDKNSNKGGNTISVARNAGQRLSTAPTAGGFAAFGFGGSSG